MELVTDGIETGRKKFVLRCNVVQTCSETGGNSETSLNKMQRPYTKNCFL